MTALGSGMHFLTGIALYLGAPLSRRPAQQSHNQQKQRRHKAGFRHPRMRLSERQKRELMDSIRNDDWHE